MNAAFATCFTAMSAQLVLPQGRLSGWAGMQDAPMALSCISLLLLLEVPKHQCWSQPHCTGQRFAASAPAWKGSQGSLAHPSCLAWALESSTQTGEYEDGGGREGKAPCWLPWQVILSSPLRQRDSVLLTQLKSLQRTPAQFLLT